MIKLFCLRLLINTEIRYPEKYLRKFGDPAYVTFSNHTFRMPSSQGNSIQIDNITASHISEPFNVNFVFSSFGNLGFLNLSFLLNDE